MERKWSSKQLRNNLEISGVSSVLSPVWFCPRYRNNPIQLVTLSLTSYKIVPLRLASNDWSELHATTLCLRHITILYFQHYFRFRLLQRRIIIFKSIFTLYSWCDANVLSTLSCFYRRVFILKIFYSVTDFLRRFYQHECIIVIIPQTLIVH